MVTTRFQLNRTTVSALNKKEDEKWKGAEESALLCEHATCDACTDCCSHTVNAEGCRGLCFPG